MFSLRSVRMREGLPCESDGGTKCSGTIPQNLYVMQAEISLSKPRVILVQSKLSEWPVSCGMLYLTKPYMKSVFIHSLK